MPNQVTGQWFPWSGSTTEAGCPSTVMDRLVVALRGQFRHVGADGLVSWAAEMAGWEATEVN